MESFRILALEVETIYQNAGAVFGEFQNQSGLTCLSGCGKCCLNPEVSASLLEMLPLAIELFDKQIAESTYDKLCEGKLSCIFYESHVPDGSQGRCGVYKSRPSICRSFGASARLNKNNQKEWVVCKLIKEKAKDSLEKVDISKSPTIGHLANKILFLDPDLGSKFYPINQALKLILEKLFIIQKFGQEI